jgi:hypothetical protein
MVSQRRNASCLLSQRFWEVVRDKPFRASQSRDLAFECAQETFAAPEQNDARAFSTTPNHLLFESARAFSQDGRFDMAPPVHLDQLAHDPGEFPADIMREGAELSDH